MIGTIWRAIRHMGHNDIGVMNPSGNGGRSSGDGQDGGSRVGSERGAHRCNGGGRFFCLWYNGAVVWWAEVQIGNRQIVKERIEDGANEKAALRFPIAALSFASISIFP